MAAGRKRTLGQEWSFETSHPKLSSVANDYLCNPRVQRAVGTALAANHIGFLIPCHRVIRESCEAGNYRWGIDCKLAMLAWESARASQ